MDAREYDSWYETRRGRWVGRREVELIYASLVLHPGESLLDVGCGTGFFTRKLAARMTGPAVGIDINSDWVEYARKRGGGRTTYVVGDARALPFPDASFDCATSNAVIGFIREEEIAIREIVRVTRRRFALGLLNRVSVHWLREGRDDGGSSYHRLHWHTVREARALFRGLPVHDLRVRTAIQLPDGGHVARLIERMCPLVLPTGGFILVTGNVGRTSSPLPRAHHDRDDV
jgi:SAM-dependent methyltransferase